MTPVCTCENPDVRDSATGPTKVCGRCGYWWVPEYGSHRAKASAMLEDVKASSEQRAQNSLRSAASQRLKDEPRDGRRAVIRRMEIEKRRAKARAKRRRR